MQMVHLISLLCSKSAKYKPIEILNPPTYAHFLEESCFAKKFSTIICTFSYWSYVDSRNSIVPYKSVFALLFPSPHLNISLNPFISLQLSFNPILPHWYSPRLQFRAFAPDCARYKCSYIIYLFIDAMFQITFCIWRNVLCSHCMVNYTNTLIVLRCR
jgi:hypothetical protein